MKSPSGNNRPKTEDGRYSRQSHPQSTPKGISARDAALRALQDVVRGDAYASLALNHRLSEARLKPEDSRLAAGLFYSAVENRLYIEHMLGKFMDQRPEPVVNDILHIAAAQILFMDRVPDHAAVDEAVKQVRAARREGFTGLVNGVLRNLIRGRDAGTLSLPDREADPMAWFRARYSVSAPLVRRLGGQVIEIAPDSPHHLNPMDVELNMTAGESPLSMKADFLLSLCEAKPDICFGVTQFSVYFYCQGRSDSLSVPR